MDARSCMIVDLDRLGDKRMFITEQVAFIKRNENGHWSVRFITSSKILQYNKARLLYYSKAEQIDLGRKGLYIGLRHIVDVRELLRFSDTQHTFYRITYTNGYTECLSGSDVYITRTPIDKIGGSTWDYLCKLASETGLLVEDGENILSKQYDLVDVYRDHVPLAQYLGAKTTLYTYRLPDLVCYPFGCNASQKKAVEAALTHQVSIIQGPPGTGKTQTILNIIANLLLSNKTVLVVSNNNSAVENVAEKLHKEGLGFLIAQLGSAERKVAFTKQQVACYPNMKEWKLDAPLALKKNTKESLLAVSQGFENQIRMAQLKAERQALTTEQYYNEMLQEEPSDENGWLCTKHSAKLIRLLALCKIKQERKERPSLLFRIKWSYLLDRRCFSLLKGSLSQVTSKLESAYYHARLSEIDQELQIIARHLQSVDLTQRTHILTNSSLEILKNAVALRYKDSTRKIFSIADIKTKSEQFLKEYPIVLSTTYSAKSCISKDMIFDYMIMDEASQVDITTGALVLSCATNAVIVGDDKQLPNIVSREECLLLEAMQRSYHIDDCYNVATHSFLQSCAKVFRDIPITLLREHYRCHPKIIEFCNQRFYGGELIPMTTDAGEQRVLQVVRTVPGNHARGHFNQREIDVIAQEVMPQYAGLGSVGIITPYRLQANAINLSLKKDIASTVHKFQGRECDTIIMSMVDNCPTEFSDDANLLNVAISRAKKHLCIVMTGNELPKESILAQLTAYIRYNNFSIEDSKLHSIFDILYEQYTAERLNYQAKHQPISEHLSEQLCYDVLLEAIQESGRKNISVVCQYPLSKLIADWSLLNAQERSFAKSPLAHVDFLVYNSLTKKPIFTIEVDGWHFHKESIVQQSRDELKDQILAKYDLAPHRLSTTDTVTKETLKKLLEI